MAYEFKTLSDPVGENEREDDVLDNLLNKCVAEG